MEPLMKKKRMSEPLECSTSFAAVGNDHIENFIPNWHLITSNIFKYLSAKDLLNLAKVSRTWFHPCREYIQRKQLQCYLVLDQVDGLGAFNSLHQVLDAKVLGYSHPFNGVHFRFTDPFDYFFKVGTGPNKRPQPVAPEPEGPQYFNFEGESNSDEDHYDNEHHDYTQDYESFEAWMNRQREEACKRYQELAKVDRPLKRIFDKIPSIKHVYMEVDYGTKKRRIFENEKFKRFLSLLPLHQIEYFRTNIRISEFIGNLRPGQLSNLRTIHIDGLMNAFPSNLQQLLAVCPALEKWDSPIPGNMVAAFGPTKRCLIKSLVLYSFVKPIDFVKIHEANLSLTTLIANAATCPIGKISFRAIVELMRDQSSTLETIQVSESFLKYVLQSAITPIAGIRTIIAGKVAKATKIKALEKFPDARFVNRTKY